MLFLVDLASECAGNSFCQRLVSRSDSCLASFQLSSSFSPVLVFLRYDIETPQRKTAMSGTHKQLKLANQTQTRSEK